MNENQTINKFQRIQRLLVMASKEESEQHYSSSKTSYIKSIDTLLDYIKSEKNERCKKIITSQAKVIFQSIIFLKIFFFFFQFALERAESLKNEKNNENPNNLTFFIHSNAIYCYEKVRNVCKEILKKKKIKGSRI